MKHYVIGGNGFLGRELVSKILTSTNDSAYVIDLDEGPSKDLLAGNTRFSVGAGDISDASTFEGLTLQSDDVVHHLASKLIVPNHPRTNRDAYFRQCAVEGTRNILNWMKKSECQNLVFWSTDMVYGPALTVPRPESHPRHPYGPYGRAKVAAEDLILEYVDDCAIRCTIFRPRLIIGPGRLGIFEKLFQLAGRGIPLPLIGNGANRFQFVSVSDCADASLLAVEKGCPNAVYNLGSKDPPTVETLTKEFVRLSGSKSKVVKTPARLVKLMLRLLNAVHLSPMDPEQYEIADADVTLDITAATEELGWYPKDNDLDMLLAAYDSYQRADGH